MARTPAKIILNKRNDVPMTLVEQTQTLTSLNEKIVLQVLQEFLRVGVKEICVCPGKRNAPFITALDKLNEFRQYFWPEERSAAFFALGRSKLTNRPVVVVTTSGTAAGELLPAAMEAYYTGIPLILLTADRPKNFRGSGAPQAAEQVGLYGQYAVFSQDIAEENECCLREWKQNGAAHLNVCLDEPLTQKFEQAQLDIQECYSIQNPLLFEKSQQGLDQFVKTSRYPFVIVGSIPKIAKDAIVKFLQNYQAPVYLEAISGLREDPRLKDLRIIRTDNILKAAHEATYPIDGILRIGGVPTFRLWRDLEDLQGKIQVCSISDLPFSGLYWGTIYQTELHSFFLNYRLHSSIDKSQLWLKADSHYSQKLLNLFEEEPLSEAALVHQLSKKIPSQSLVYLGNSLPIREWDAYATEECEHLNVFASRGLSGIDGQISTFFGMCAKNMQNWGLIGDLTAIYDLAGPWILDQMQDIDLNLVIVNNGGGKIFARMFPLKQIQNPHQIRFKSLAELWNMRYECYSKLPETIPYGGHRLIEIIPNEESTIRFWNKIGKI